MIENHKVVTIVYSWQCELYNLKWASVVGCSGKVQVFDYESYNAPEIAKFKAIGEKTKHVVNIFM